jgi:hypothetical protein
VIELSGLNTLQIQFCAAVVCRGRTAGFNWCICCWVLELAPNKGRERRSSNQACQEFVYEMNTTAWHHAKHQLQQVSCLMATPCQIQQGLEQQHYISSRLYAVIAYKSMSCCHGTVLDCTTVDCTHSICRALWQAVCVIMHDAPDARHPTQRRMPSLHVLLC